MKKEIIINVEKGEERVALLENSKLVEFFVNINIEKSLNGDIYCGIVQNVLPGIQSAFVDIGREKNAFLNINDIENVGVEADEVDSFSNVVVPTRGPRKIEEFIKAGQKVMVQVIKEAIGTKGPRSTTNISIPGNFVVLMPNSQALGVSRKILDKSKRKFLYELAKKHVPDNMGMILRTACEGRSEKDLVSEIKVLLNMWKDIQQKYQKSQVPGMLYRDLEPSEKIVRDTLAEDIDSIIVDDKAVYEKIKKMFKNVKHITTKIELYKQNIPIFDTYGIEESLERGVSRVVPLKSGGSLVFDEAEALVAIDINTRHFVGRKSQEETVFLTNMEAAEEIPRQLRLRDIGGIIIIDFIDMEKEDHRDRVFSTLKENLKRDKAQTDIFPISSLGLVEMSRKRVRKSLKSQITRSCPYCDGTGMIFSGSTQAFKIIRELKRAFWLSKETEFLVVLNQEIFYSMITDYRRAIEDLQAQAGRKVYLSYAPEYHHHDIRITSLQTKEEIVSTFSTFDGEREIVL